MNALRVSLVQTDLVWENPLQNRMNLEKKIVEIEETDIVILPEMFTTGFSMHPKGLAETMEGETVEWMKRLSKERSIAICGSLIINDHNKYFNRFVFVSENEEVKTYDKRHLFTLAGEHHEYEQGTDKQIISHKGWNICPLICYDLRFPVWSRYEEDYDLLIYVANWPKPRISAWDALLRSRAIENMSYTIGVNRVGMDANGHEYIGNSAVLDSLGNKISTLKSNEQRVETISLNKEDQEATRKKFNFLSDRDYFKINS